MKALTQWMLITAMAFVYLLALLAILHPRVSPAYKSYYIDRTSSDWNPARYPATPDQGISFSRRGLPDWVDSTYGLSLRDDRGRWTDGDLVRIPGLSFTQKFNGPLCLEFTASPAMTLIGKTFAVQMGNQTKTLQVIPQGSAEYRVQFTQVQGADRLNFLLPQRLPRESEVDRANGDTRRLGLELIKLRILPGSCATTAAKDGPATASVQQENTDARDKKAVADPPALQAPALPPASQASAPPPSLEQMPPTPPEVIYQNGLLTIKAQNSTLSQILRAVQARTGASVEGTNAASERVATQLGPGQPRDVLDTLLTGSKFNYILLGVIGSPGAVQKIILTPRQNATSTLVNRAQNDNPDQAQQEEKPQEKEMGVNYGEPGNPAPRTVTPVRFHPEVTAPSFPPPQPDRRQDDGNNPQTNEVKTPEQLQQDLQQMQQQQLQMQQQLNPANRLQQ